MPMATPSNSYGMRRTVPDRAARTPAMRSTGNFLRSLVCTQRRFWPSMERAPDRPGTSRCGPILAESRSPDMTACSADQGGCGPGIQSEIPPNSLVDSTGAAPAGNVQVALTTVDINSPEQMPGDDTVLQASGATRVMQSYGAGTIEVFSGTKPLNLK